MAVACSPGGGPNDSGRRGVRLVERISQGLATWCADGSVEYGDPEHIWYGESQCCAGPEQTAEFVKRGYDRWARWSAIVALLLTAGIGYAALCRGVERVEAQRAMRATMPEIRPLQAMPPIDAGGCIATRSTGGIVELRRYNQ